MAYTQKEREEIVERVCEYIVENNAPLRHALELHDRPTRKTFYKWLDENEDFVNQYMRACEERADVIFEEILDIADESNADVSISDEGQIIKNGDIVQRSRLRIDARKWMLGKMQPTKYGDKIDVTSGGEKLQQAIINIDPLNDKTNNSTQEDMQS